MNCDLCGKPASHWSTDYQDLPERDGWKVVGIRHGWCAVHKPTGATPLASAETARVRSLPSGLCLIGPCARCHRTSTELDASYRCPACAKRAAVPDERVSAARLEQRNQTTLVFLFFSLGAILGMVADLVGRLLNWW